MIGRAEQKPLVGQRTSGVNRLGEESIVNVFTPPTSSSKTSLVVTPRKPRNDGQRLVHQIINSIFEEQVGTCEASSSRCSSVDRRSSEYSFDKRLSYWKNMIRERKLIERHIKKKTGKLPSAVLFNRSQTVDERDKQTVKRLMDYAERMNPITLTTKRPICLPEYIDLRTCTEVRELQETLPKAERDQCKCVEITGMPAVTKEEQLGKRKHQGVESKSHWLRSKVLEQRIDEKREDIERVIEYYPDIENLQIVGESFSKVCLLRHNSEIKLLPDHILGPISSDSSCEVTSQKKQEARNLLEDNEPCDYAVRINDQILKVPLKRGAKSMEFESHFECKPFETMVRRAIRVVNIGRKAINCEWVHRAFYEKNAQLLKCQDEEFLFNHKPFRLVAGEGTDIIIQFQPRRCDIIKERWLLKLDPPFFCRKGDAVVVKLTGRCRAPRMYTEKLNMIQRNVIDKSNMKVMRKLTTGLASLTPLIKPDEVICPYKRTLNELELFEFYNIGYKCDRYHDLELLKNLHKRVKKPREPAWDLNIDTLKTLILRLEGAEQRALVFGELVGVLEDMKGQPVKLEERLLENNERDRTRFLYVRGIICTGIDEWEELANTVEKAFVDPAIKEYYDSLLREEEEEEEDEEMGAEGEERTPIETIFLDDEEVRERMQKKVHKRKAFRDSLYMHTYTHICNFVEDIVSVIESTEII